MKQLLIIISILLSFFVGGKWDVCAVITQVSDAIVKEASHDEAIARTINRDICFTSAQTGSISGSERVGGSSFRTAPQGQRTSQTFKSGNRLIRTSKLIDTHNFNIYFSNVLIKWTGILSECRYIYSIGFLRL